MDVHNSDSSHSQQHEADPRSDIGLAESTQGHASGDRLGDYQSVAPLSSDQDPQSEDSKTSSWNARLSRRASWGSFWVFEIGALIFSLIFMIAIMVVLSQIDGQPVRKWRLPLAPNTLIAVFATLSKSAMLLVISECISQLKWVYFEQRGQRLFDLQTFDDASRGPIGAVHLLFQIRWKALAASFGALLIIMALAQDAFYQEIYSTYTDDTAQTSEVAKLALTRVYDTKSTPDSGISAKRALSTVMLNGLSIPQDPRFECPSGNCTWPPFDSLGVCSSREDATQEIVKSCEKYDKIDSWVKCNYTFRGHNDPVVLQAIVDDQFGVPTTGTILKGGKLSRGNFAETLEIARLGVLRITQESFGNDIKGKNVTSELIKILSPIAYDCVFTWCVKHYGPAALTNGVLAEPVTIKSLDPTKIGSHNVTFGGRRDPNMGSENLAVLNEEGPSPYSQWFEVVQGRLDKLEAIIQYDKESRQSRASFCSNAKVLSQETDSFMVRDDVFEEISNILQQLVSDSIFNDYAAWNYAFVNDPDYAVVGNKILPQMMYYANNGNITRTMENIATSLTNYIRSNLQTEDHYGTVYRTEIYMKVEWAWLAYPVALLSLATLLLCTSMIFSAERSRAVWKSSSIATLFHGLQGWPKDDLMEDRVEKIEESAKNMRVKLQRDRDGHLALLRE